MLIFISCSSMASESIFIRSAQKAIICGLNVILTPDEFAFSIKELVCLQVTADVKHSILLQMDMCAVKHAMPLLGTEWITTAMMPQEHPYFPDEVVGTQFVVKLTS